MFECLSVILTRNDCFNLSSIWDAFGDSKNPLERWRWASMFWVPTLFPALSHNNYVNYTTHIMFIYSWGNGLTNISELAFWICILCMGVWVHVCKHKHVQVHLPVSLWRPEVSLGRLPYSCPSFETESLPEPGAQVQLGWLVSELLGSTCPF